MASLWDSDTLATSSARFPNMAAMMVSNFARHSRESHAWRANDRLKRLEAKTVNDAQLIIGPRTRLI
jgi:hypothetical protein